MLTEKDISRSAQSLIKRHGKDAPAQVAMKSDEMLNRGMWTALPPGGKYSSFRAGRVICNHQVGGSSPPAGTSFSAGSDNSAIKYGRAGNPMATTLVNLAGVLMEPAGAIGDAASALPRLSDQVQGPCLSLLLTQSGPIRALQEPPLSSDRVTTSAPRLSAWIRVQRYYAANKRGRDNTTSPSVLRPSPERSHLRPHP